MEHNDTNFSLYTYKEMNDMVEVETEVEVVVEVETEVAETKFRTWKIQKQEYIIRLYKSQLYTIKHNGIFVP